MPVISYVNPLSELATAQAGISQAQQEDTFAEHLVELAIYGYGDPAVARHILAVTRANIGNQRQREDFWINMIKEEKQSMKKAWDLVKDS